MQVQAGWTLCTLSSGPGTPKLMKCAQLPGPLMLQHSNCFGIEHWTGAGGYRRACRPRVAQMRQSPNRLRGQESAGIHSNPVSIDWIISSWAMLGSCIGQGRAFDLAHFGTQKWRQDAAVPLFSRLPLYSQDQDPAEQV